ncbi:MAG: hypothetical protein JW795_01950 [Chitinivibrionales bacterium]|nr:hypothetical protein [Chitinivibrionales bacterium]
MAEVGLYRNVFDDQNEFNKLNDLILGAIQEFADYRKGNLTYGEIMFVMECILDSMRTSSEKDATTSHTLKGVTSPPTFTSLMESVSRTIETFVKKGIITTADEKYIRHGE